MPRRAVSNRAARQPLLPAPVATLKTVLARHGDQTS
jgi:hypothetical protein